MEGRSSVQRRKVIAITALKDIVSTAVADDCAPADARHVVIKRESWDKIVELAEDKLRISSNMQGVIYAWLLKQERFVALQDIMEGTRLKHSAVHYALVALVLKHQIIRERRVDTDWPWHPNVGRWYYSIIRK